MDLQKIHDTIDTMLRKSRSGYVSPEQKDDAINWGQDELFERIKPALGSNQQVNDALLPFKKRQSFNNGSSPSGLITLNADYYHLLACKTVINDSDGNHNILVPIVGEDSEFEDSQLIPLSVYNPSGMLYEPASPYGQYRLQLFPQQVSAGTVFYLRKPAQVHFAYSTSGRTITYHSGSSTQLEWNDASTRKIIELAVERLALTLQDVNTTQYEQAKGGQP